MVNGSNRRCINEDPYRVKSAKGFKYDRNAMTWMPEDAPATTGSPANPPPRAR
jgi:hypothetical protein